MLFVVGLHRLFSVTSRMDHMCPRYVAMVRSFLVVSSLVVLGCFPMVTGSVSKMFLHLLVVFGSLFGHYRLLPGCGERSNFSALEFARQKSDGSVSARLSKPSTNTAVNAAISVMWAEKTIALVSDSPMTLVTPCAVGPGSIQGNT